MSGRVVASNDKAGGRPSRQINVVLSSHEQPVLTKVVSEREKSKVSKGTLEQDLYQDILRDMEQLVGLENIKDLIFEIYALLQVSLMRVDAGLAGGSQVYHMIFRGNPGTGKTTVARIIAKLFQRMGVLTKGHLIEVERADLVGEYIGHTAQKTRDLVKKSLGGILFIDEAYSLARGGEKDFGKEAIDTLVKSMEDHKNQFILILAGYCDEMDFFLQTNPGLPSRFPIQVDFSDYTVDQLIQIAELMAKDRDYILMPQAVIKLRNRILQEKTEGLHAFSNARYVRNMIEKSMRNHAVRLLNQFENNNPGKQELMTLRTEDFKFNI
ncbi:AAA family ATPase [Paenibacillus sp. CMAA1364]